MVDSRDIKIPFHLPDSNGETTMQPIQTIVETGIYVSNLVEAEAFYLQLLGLPVIAKDPERHVFFRVGDDCVLLAFLPDATLVSDQLPSHGSKGPGHFALGIPKGSLEDWKTYLTENGVLIETEVKWPRGGRSIYFRDPAGNSVELLTPGLWGLPTGW